jgi:predicted transcriptional regulator
MPNPDLITVLEYSRGDRLVVDERPVAAHLILENAFDTLTRARIGVYRKVKEKESISITALAGTLKRPREAVSRDVTALRSAGLVKMRNVSNPGHGRVVMVSPAAKKIFVEL